MPSRILIIEDEALTSLLLEEILETNGFEVAAVASRPDTALNAIDRLRPDGAILDLTLHGEPAFDVADHLAARGVPFVISSGLVEDDLPERFQSMPRLAKPFAEDAVVVAVRDLLAAQQPTET